MRKASHPRIRVLTWFRGCVKVAAMPTHPVMELKRICHHADHGIYNLASLATFMHIDPAHNQQDLARLTEQSDSSVGQWIKLFLMRGLITMEVVEKPVPSARKKGGVAMRKTSVIAHTEYGLKLKDALNKLMLK